MKLKDFTLEETITDIKSSPQYCSDRNYILWMAKTTPWRGRRVVSILQEYFNKNAKLLDVGSSQGLTFCYLAQVFPRIEGVDTDLKATKTAKKRLNALDLRNNISLSNGVRLPYPDSIFDGVVSTEVFEHVNDTNNFLKEIARVLKPRGKLIISTPNKLYPIECEFHLPFLSYLPRRLADFYVKASGKGKSYNDVNHPIYKRFRSEVNNYFDTKDITFRIIKNYKKYFLDKERGEIAIVGANILNRIDKFPFLRKIVTNFLPGWFLIGIKK